MPLMPSPYACMSLFTFLMNLNFEFSEGKVAGTKFVLFVNDLL